MVDYIQEDLDSMDKELLYWQKESHKYESILQKESSKENSAMDPINGQLDKIEEAIQEQVKIP